jgi:hypothetical protein
MVASRKLYPFAELSLGTREGPIIVVNFHVRDLNTPLIGPVRLSPFVFFLCWISPSFPIILIPGSVSGFPPSQPPEIPDFKAGNLAVESGLSIVDSFSFKS